MLQLFQEKMYASSYFCNYSLSTLKVITLNITGLMLYTGLRSVTTWPLHYDAVTNYLVIATLPLDLWGKFLGQHSTYDVHMVPQASH